MAKATKTVEEVTVESSETEVIEKAPVLDETVPKAPSPPDRPSKKPSARAWLIAAIVSGAVLVGMIGFITGGLVTANRIARNDSRSGLQQRTFPGGSITMRQTEFSQSPSSERRYAGNSASITAVSDSSISVKFSNGATAAYAIDGDTRIVKSDDSDGTISDLKVGDSITLRGGYGVTGTLTATLIAIAEQ